MKYMVSCAASILISAILLSVLPVHGEAELYNDVLRFHVIAESDSEEDQALKLKVRDEVLECLSIPLSQCDSFQEAYETVLNMQEEIAAAAENCVKLNGYDYAVTVKLGQEHYPRREYGETTMPSGVYNSLRVIIGDGEGHNWWCVLFPTVCVKFAEADKDEYIAAGFTPEEYKIITGENAVWRVRFKVLEMLADVLGFEY